MKFYEADPPYVYDKWACYKSTILHDQLQNQNLDDFKRMLEFGESKILLKFWHSSVLTHEYVEVLSEHLLINNKIRDLKVFVENPKELLIILNSLAQNYVIKTCILHGFNSNSGLDDELKDKAKDIAQEMVHSRVGLEVILVYDEQVFYKNRAIPASIYYP